jgi:hypothetical protein
MVFTTQRITSTGPGCWHRWKTVTLKPRVCELGVRAERASGVVVAMIRNRIHASIRRVVLQVRAKSRQQ